MNNTNFDDLWMGDFVDSEWLDLEILNKTNTVLAAINGKYATKKPKKFKVNASYLLLSVEPLYAGRVQYTGSSFQSSTFRLENGSTLLTSSDEFGKLWIAIKVL